MRLTYLWIQRFGKLKEKEIFLEDGINVIYGPNESGKSTLHSFIRGMLFGMPRYRGRASKTDPYTRFEPWERPADYAGSMRFEAGGKEFRIDRNFYKSDVRESLICETDGEQLSIRQGDLSILLGGISESVYDNTVSIGQLRSETDEGMVRELQNYMSNYEGAGSGEVDVQRASERLKKKKKEWELQKQMQEERQSRQREQIENRMAYVRQEKEELERQLENVRRDRKELERQLKNVRRDQKSTENEGRDRREVNRHENQKSSSDRVKPSTPMVLGGIFLLGALGMDIILKNTMKSSLWPVISLCMFVIGVFLLFTGAAEMKRTAAGRAAEETAEKAAKRAAEKAENKQTGDQYGKMSDRINRLLGREEELSQQLEERTTVLQNLLENREDLQESSDEIRLCETEIESLELAMKTLTQLSGIMRLRIGHRLQNRMENILGEITDGKYGRIVVDEDMKITLYEWNRRVSLYQLSRGTVEQVYFALRMAVSEILCEEKLPVLLDDVFAMYDEERLKQTLKWLAGRSGQVLIFTCHKREAQMLSELGIQANYIAM